MMMETIGSYETLVFIYHTTQFHITEARNLYIQSCYTTPQLYEVHANPTQLAQNGVQ
jgi:hypothetical protein